MTVEPDYSQFFQRATGCLPYPYQSRLATGDWPNMLDVPTGLGKTAAVTLAWLYRRRVLGEDDMPRRLIWCLPMRVLVEQTLANVCMWLERLKLFAEPGSGKVSVHALMGGEPTLRRAGWAHWPEEEAILIGTQDMLLSRALMRGYGMSRYQWPVHFALLHSDALWVYDEIQLMGPALATSAQLEAFRRTFRVPKPARSLWVSATLRAEWLGTVDFRDHAGDMRPAELDAQDLEEPQVRKRLSAVKNLTPASTRLTVENAASRAAAYVKSLAAEIAEHHRIGQQTLVILNRVDRAQGLYRALGKHLNQVERLLLHARFRPGDRRALERRLAEVPGEHGRIIVATQAVEAGVDLSSEILFTELAPWSALVQRFGRCNRAGEHVKAEIRWIDIDDDVDQAAPYSQAELRAARDKLEPLDSASPASLPGIDETAPVSQILRRKDFVQLFNTDSDLSGFDTDISPYIRDPGTPQLQVFWRHIAQRPGDDIAPGRDELCPAGLGQILDFLRRKGTEAWAWDALGGRWQTTTRPRPGQVLLLRAEQGGYSPEQGFAADLRVPVDPIESEITEQESLGSEELTFIGRPVELGVHLKDAERKLKALASALELAAWQVQAAATADLWHDVGKAHEAFQRGIQSDFRPGQSPVLAKSGGAGRPDFHVLGDDARKVPRPGFRHELASMLAWLEHGQDEEHRDLIAYLICAHHGRIRMGLRALPGEREPPEPDRLFARGIWQGDRLPESRLNGATVPATELRLNLMALGNGPQGPSWTERTWSLLETHGPFELAWLEALVRIADWRASAREAG